MQTLLRVEQDDVETALSDLGVPLSVLIEAVQAGYVSRISRTTNDAPNAAGFYQWNETVRSLRDNMVVHNWQSNNDGNWPTIVHPEKSLAIAVSSGNQATGSRNGKTVPSTRAAKGPRTAAAVSRNSKQMSLFPDLEPPQIEPAPQYPTWLLLFYTDAAELRAELSLPINMDCEGFVSLWRERIVLPSISLDPATTILEPDFGPDVDIKIVRKG